MTTTAYSLPLTNGLTLHGRPKPLLMHDGDTGSAPDNLELEARVRSGYYFISLSTTLETIVANLSKHDQGAGLLIDKLITDLDYLQQHYTITKRVGEGRTTYRNTKSSTQARGEK